MHLAERLCRRTDKTILVVEVRDSQINWAEPSDLDRTTMSLTIGGPADRSIGSHHVENSLGFRRHVVGVLFADGSIRFLDQTLPPEALEALLTRDGGESVASLPTP